MRIWTNLGSDGMETRFETPSANNRAPSLRDIMEKFWGFGCLVAMPFLLAMLRGKSWISPYLLGWVRLEKASLLDALPSSSGLKNHTYQPFGTVHKSIRMRQENCYYALAGFNMHCIYCQTSSNLKITSQEVASGGNSNTYSEFLLAQALKHEFLSESFPD